MWVRSTHTTRLKLILKFTFMLEQSERTISNIDNELWEIQEDVALRYGKLPGESLTDYLALDYHLFEDGNSKIQVSLIIRNISQTAIDHIPWVIHLRGNRVFSGFRFTPNPKIITVSSAARTHKSDELKAWILSFEILPIQQNQTIHLQFEYLCDEPIIVAEDIWSSQYKYPIVYTPLSPIKSFDIRVHLPRNAQYKLIEKAAPRNKSIAHEPIDQAKAKTFLQEFQMSEHKALVGVWNADKTSSDGDTLKLEAFLAISYPKKYALPLTLFLASTVYALVLFLIRESESYVGSIFIVIASPIFWTAYVLALLRVLNNRFV